MNHDLQGNFRQPGFSVFNASLSYTTPDRHVKLTAFGTNIFNEEYIAGILISGIATSVTYVRPPTYGLRLEFDF
jgi:iron complex outermembrane receptor protein